MKNKILFIVPPLSINNKVKFANHQAPLGFLYMANVLEKNGFEVKIIDCPLYYTKRRKIDNDTDKVGLDNYELRTKIKLFNPDIVGVSCSYSMFEEDSFRVINLVKEINKEIFTVVGGAHASSNPGLVLRNRNIDLAVIGEGEITMLEIAKNFMKGKDMKHIKGTALYLKELIVNPKRELIENLDDYEPAWHLINLDDYFKHPDNSAATIRKPSMTIITSRGCVGNCAFCSVQTIWGRKWRAISANKVVDQIEYLYSKGIKHFRINDDNLTIDKTRIMAICNEIVKRKLDIKWDTPSGVAMWALDEEVLSAMKRSGYYRITFGIESGSYDTLKYIGKNINLDMAKEIIRCSNKLGLWTASFFIIGFPHETKEDIQKTADFIVNSEINFPFIFIAQPYSGTRMYDDFKNSGLMDEGIIGLSNSTVTKYRTDNFSPEELNKIRGKIYLRFYFKKVYSYLNPFKLYKEFISKIRTYEDFKYAGRMISAIVTNILY